MAWDGRPRWSVRALGPPVALVVVAVLVVSPWTIRNQRTLHHFVPVSTQLGSALAGTYNDDARTDKKHPASWRSLHHVASYQDLVGDLAHTDEAVLEKQLRARAERYVLDHPTYVGVVAFWTTVRGLDLGGLDWAKHTARTVSIDSTWAVRNVRCFWVFALLALGGRVHHRGAAHAVVRLGVPRAHVPERRVPRDRDPPVPHADGPVHRDARGARPRVGGAVGRGRRTARLRD